MSQQCITGNSWFDPDGPNRDTEISRHYVAMCGYLRDVGTVAVGETIEGNNLYILINRLLNFHLSASTVSFPYSTGEVPAEKGTQPPIITQLLDDWQLKIESSTTDEFKDRWIRDASVHVYELMEEFDSRIKSMKQIVPIPTIEAVACVMRICNGLHQESIVRMLHDAEEGKYELTMDSLGNDMSYSLSVKYMDHLLDMCKAMDQHLRDGLREALSIA